MGAMARVMERWQPFEPRNDSGYFWITSKNNDKNNSKDIGHDAILRAYSAAAGLSANESCTYGNALISHNQPCSVCNQNFLRL
jgi:hypothetical protein